jgi:hypothetical protein
MHTIETFKPVISTNPIVQLLHWIFYRFKRTLPQEWNELTAEQLQALPEILLHRDADPEVKKILIADKILKLPAWVMRSLTEVQLLQLVETMDWIFERPQLTKTLIKKFPCAGKTYHGPSDHWYDVEFGQYKDVLKYLKYFADTEDPQHLRTALAAIYRPHNWRGKHKEYDPSQLEARMQAFENLAPEFIEALMFQVHGCLNEIETEFYEVFEEAGDEDGDIEALVLSMSGAAFGDYANTFHQPVWLVMHEMRRLVRAQRKREEDERNASKE